MPKQTTKKEHRRSAPYNLRTMATMASPMTSWAPQHHGHSHSLSWDGMNYQPMPNYIQMPPAPLAPLAPLVPRPASTQPGQSTPWTVDEDNRLIEAKQQSLGWNEIQKLYFPTKSGNACRKRHERLMVKLRTTDWNEERIRKVIAAYNSPGFRERFWSLLSDQVDEAWQDVERVCFQQGLKGLRARAHHSRDRSASNRASDYDHSEYEHTDDSGIGLGVSRRSSQMLTQDQLQREHLLPSLDDNHGYGYR